MEFDHRAWRNTAFYLILWFIAGCLSSAAKASDVRVAVASNFFPVAVILKAAFEHDQDYEVLLSAGSTGKHYAQIRQGAPFDLFLAADADRPARLVESGIGQPNSLANYAVGELLVWHPGAGSPEAALERLQNGSGYIAIANPRLAPYGRAAQQTLDSLNLTESTRARLVTGENIAQAFQFVASGNAETGLIAKSQLKAVEHPSRDVWPVPADMHEPIVQQMLLLSDSEAARAFYEFMLTPTATEIIATAGYSNTR